MANPVQGTEARDRVLSANPPAQIPTLILPDGTVMTESAAITLLLTDIAGRDDLVPGPLASERARFLCWLIFMVANIFPTFTCADDPARFVDGGNSAAPPCGPMRTITRNGSLQTHLPSSRWVQCEGLGSGPCRTSGGVTLGVSDLWWSGGIALATG